MEIITCRPEHLGELLSFLHRQFPEAPQKGNASFFEWRFAGSPLGSSLENYHLAIENGRIIGQLGAMRDRLWARGRWWDCCWLVDLIVGPEHRGPRSTAVPRLYQAVMKKCPLLLVTGAGPKQVRFYKTLGWDYREVFGTYYAIRRPGRLLALAQDAREKGPVLKPLLGPMLGPMLAPMMGPVLPLADVAMTGLQAGRSLWRKWPRPHLEFDRPQQFGGGAGDLIERVLPSLPVTSHRSPAYLNWKFNQRPGGTHFIITAWRNGHSRMCGYIAVKVMERPPHARWAEIVDYLVEPGDLAAFEGLLDQAARRALEADVDFLRLRCSLPEHQNLLRAPFWIRRNRPVIDGTFFRTEDAELKKALAVEPWHLTSLVSDRTDQGSDEFTARGKVIGQVRFFENA